MSVNTKVNGQLVKSAGLYSVSTPIGMADIYSTEEKEIGLWVDNKPLYQKSIKLDDVTVPQSGRVLIGLGTYISNIDNVIGGEVIVIDGSTNLVLPSFQIATMSQYGLTYTINKSDGIVISRGSDSGAVTRDFIATVRYTKTTDTPWSGKFVPQGYGYVSSGDIYSFEERQIGVFADGKPLYQKTYEFTNVIQVSANSYTTLITNCGLNIDAIVYGESSPSKSETFTPISVKHENDNISCYYNTSWSVKYLTIKYTKTTDVAGSGEYVPSGDKAVHYSTEEQVVGTWFGETLYEKTIDIGTLPNSATSKTYAHGITGNIVRYDISAIDASGTVIQLPFYTTANNYNIGVYVTSTNIVVETQRDSSGYTHCYATLRYTKASS